jgi:nicotinate-nucleotide pyrophosphorylase (carboxylating)
MNKKIKKEDILKLIELAIAEDINTGDVTSEAIFSNEDSSTGRIVSKDTGIFCGMDIIQLVYRHLDPAIHVTAIARDGDTVSPGNEISRIEGPTIGILSGERIVLNFIQRMSGIATKTHSIVSLLEGTSIRILDTRKTLPGFRILDKYAVVTGGGTNHRMGLFDMVMIKDNHIKAAGTITAAVNLVRKQHRDTFKIEVETTTPEEVKEAVASGVDIIMLDNMDKPLIKECISIIDGRCKIEISGNMDEERIKEIKDLAIDFISIGSLTHSVTAFDLSTKFS